MSKFTVLISEPDQHRIQRGDYIWILLGLTASDKSRANSCNGATHELEEDIVRRLGDSCIIKICSRDKNPVRIWAWKGITSSYEIFYAILDDDTILVADNFRSIVSQLPMSLRYPSDAAIVDHFLYRCVPGENTYCRSVKRLGHGDRMVIDVASRKVETASFDRLDSQALSRPVGDYIEQVDKALASVLVPLRKERRSANLFSGGVDSTLIQSYLNTCVEPINVVSQTDDFQSKIEAKYRDDSAKRLGIKVRVLCVDKHFYREQLERLIQDIAMPPHHMVSVFYGEAFKLDFQKYIVGEKADALFGWGARAARVSRLFASSLGINFLRPITWLLPPSNRFRWHRLLPTAHSLSLEPNDPLGYGLQVATFTHLPTVEEIFGIPAVRQRLQARLSYATQKVNFSAPKEKRFLRHIETAQFIDYFCDDTFMIYRQIANSLGKSVFSPFLARCVVSAALEVPVTQRYFRGRQGKYLLKRLLTKRHPGYHVNQRKGYTIIPLSDYFAHGPLHNIWEYYRFPDFIDARLRERLQSHPNNVTWNALAYAVWNQKVARNPDLKPPLGTVVFTSQTEN